MRKKAKNITILGVDRSNIEDFSALFTEDAVKSILEEDGTTALVAKLEDEYAGALAGKLVTDTKYQLSSLFVAGDYRRQGVGTALLNALKNVLQGLSLEIFVSFLKLTEQEEGLAAFLEAMGFEEYAPSGAHVFATDLDAVSKLDFIDLNSNFDFTPFKEIPKTLFDRLKAAPGRSFLPLPEGGFENAMIDRDLSLGLVTDRRLLGYIIVESLDEKTVSLSHLYMDPSLPQLAWLSMMKQLLTEGKKKYKKGVRIILPVVNSYLEKWIEGFFPGEAIEEISVDYRLPLEMPEFDYENGSLSEFLDYSGMPVSDSLFA